MTGDDDNDHDGNDDDDNDDDDDDDDDDDESNFLIQRWTMIEMSGQDSLDCASSDD